MHTLSYHASSHSLLLFGGCSSAVYSSGILGAMCWSAANILGDLWRFNLVTNTWTQLHPENAPSPRFGAAAAALILSPHDTFRILLGSTTHVENATDVAGGLLTTSYALNLTSPTLRWTALPAFNATNLSDGQSPAAALLGLYTTANAVSPKSGWGVFPLPVQTTGALAQPSAFVDDQWLDLSLASLQQSSNIKASVVNSFLGSTACFGSQAAAFLNSQADSFVLFAGDCVSYATSTSPEYDATFSPDGLQVHIYAPADEGLLLVDLVYPQTPSTSTSTSTNTTAVGMLGTVLQVTAQGAAQPWLPTIGRIVACVVAAPLQQVICLPAYQTPVPDVIPGTQTGLVWVQNLATAAWQPELIRFHPQPPMAPSSIRANVQYALPPPTTHTINASYYLITHFGPDLASWSVWQLLVSDTDLMQLNLLFNETNPTIACQLAYAAITLHSDPRYLIAFGGLDAESSLPCVRIRTQTEETGAFDLPSSATLRVLDLEQQTWQTFAPPDPSSPSPTPPLAPWPRPRLGAAWTLTSHPILVGGTIAVSIISSAVDTRAIGSFSRTVAEGRVDPASTPIVWQLTRLHPHPTWTPITTLAAPPPVQRKIPAFRSWPPWPMFGWTASLALSNRSVVVLTSTSPLLLSDAQYANMLAVQTALLNSQVPGITAASPSSAYGQPFHPLTQAWMLSLPDATEPPSAPATWLPLLSPTDLSTDPQDMPPADFLALAESPMAGAAADGTVVFVGIPSRDILGGALPLPRLLSTSPTCMPGTFSADFPANPCQLCPAGTYKSGFSVNTPCTACPAGLTTDASDLADGVAACSACVPDYCSHGTCSITLVRGGTVQAQCSCSFAYVGTRCDRLWPYLPAVVVGAVLFVLGVVLVTRTSGRIWRRNRTQRQLLAETTSELASLNRVFEIAGDDVELLRRIDGGVGALGEVWMGDYCGLPVAVKILLESRFQMSEESACELECEAAALKTLRHRNIVIFFGAGTLDRGEGARPFLVTEYMASGSLAGLLHGEGASEGRKYAMDLSQRLDYLEQAASGMAFLHGLSPARIHRDLKPANLLISADRRLLKVADFGTARLVTLVKGGAGADDVTGLGAKIIRRRRRSAAAEVESGLAQPLLYAESGSSHSDIMLQEITMTSEVGTPLYCAPEVLRGAAYGCPCDIFSFGIIIWEVIERRHPYDTSSSDPLPVLLDRVVAGLRPGPWQAMHSETARIAGDSSVAEGVEQLAKQCWAPEPHSRPLFPQIRARLAALRRH